MRRARERLGFSVVFRWFSLVFLSLFQSKSMHGGELLADSFVLVCPHSRARPYCSGKFAKTLTNPNILLVFSSSSRARNSPTGTNKNSRVRTAASSARRGFAYSSIFNCNREIGAKLEGWPEREIISPALWVHLVCVLLPEPPPGSGGKPASVIARASVDAFGGMATLIG